MSDADVMAMSDGERTERHVVRRDWQWVQRLYDTEVVAGLVSEENHDTLSKAFRKSKSAC